MTTALPAGIPRNPAPLCQLHEPTKDGLPDEDANDNCGETAMAWVVRDIGNEPDCDGDEIHDEVIGQGVLGGSDLLTGTAINPKYAAALDKRGVVLTPFFGTQAELVAKAHEILNLSAGDTVANFGGGSQYLASFADPVHFSGFGHICALAHNLSGGIQLMDPWIGGWRNYTDAQLEQMIVWGYLVIALPKSTGGTSVSFIVPAGWSDDGTTMHDPAGTPVIGAMRLFVGNPNNHWDPADIPLGPEFRVDCIEYGNPALSHPGAIQFFKISGQVSWDGTFAGGAAWRTWSGQEIAALRTDMMAAQKSASDAQASAKTLTDDLAQASATNASLQRQLDAANLTISQLQAAPPPAPAPAPEADAMVKLIALLDSLGIQHT